MEFIDYRSMRFFRARLIKGACLLLAIFFIACKQSPRESIYDTELHSVSGDSAVSMTDLQGKPILIEFWSSGCSPCVASIAKLNRFHEAFGRDLTVLFVNPSEDRQTVLDFMDERRIEANVLLDTEKRLYTRLGDPTLGTAFLYNREGELIWSGALYFLEEKMVRAVLEGGSYTDESADRMRTGLTLEITASNGKEENSISISYDGVNDESTFSTCTLSSVLISLLSRRYGCNPAEIKAKHQPYGPYINLRARNLDGLPLEEYLDGIIGVLQRMFKLDIHVTEEQGIVSIIVDYSRIRGPEGFKYYRTK